MFLFQGLREILERYMEDDQDMYRMCLSKWRDAELENADAGSDNTLLIGAWWNCRAAIKAIVIFVLNQVVQWGCRQRRHTADRCVIDGLAAA
jgi:hypothetical protein